MSSFSPVNGGRIFKNKICPSNTFFVKTPKIRVSSAKGVHLAEILLRVTKTEKCTRCVQGNARYPIKV